MKTTASKCKHLSYRITDGDLVCSECGEPSQSPKWRGNVYGVKHDPISETDPRGAKLSV